MRFAPRIVAELVCLVLTACTGASGVNDTIAGAPQAVLAVGPPEPVIIQLRHYADQADTALVSGNVGLSQRPVSADMPVRIASISKLVTALGVMRLVDKGLIDLDRDVGDYLGWQLRNPDFPGTPVTMRMLLSHTASLRDDAGYYLPLDGSLRDLVADPMAWDADHAPGSGHFAYANIASPVIAAVMERASGKRFDTLMAEEVFAPLGLSACFNWSGCKAGQRANAITLLRPNGDIAKDPVLGEGKSECAFVPAPNGNCDLSLYRLGENGSAFSPQGGLRISANEMMAIGALIQSQDTGFLTPQSWREMLSPQWARNGENYDAEGYATWQWGLGIELLPNGWAGHSADAYGLRAGLWVHKARGETAVNITTMVDEAAPVGDCLESCP